MEVGTGDNPAPQVDSKQRDRVAVPVLGGVEGLVGRVVCLRIVVGEESQLLVAGVVVEVRVEDQSQVFACRIPYSATRRWKQGSHSWGKNVSQNS